MRAALGCMIAAALLSAQEVKIDSDTISGLVARNIGSAEMSGRVAALAAVRVDGRLTVYVGSASGGVWKSENGGTTFKPVFDKQPVQSIGAIAIDPSASKTVWVGTGEAWTRNSVSIGNGIYKSTDDGGSWTPMGLSNSERISKILIDPKDGNTVYVCAPGKLWSDSDDRGVYKTTDGGKTWNKILKGANASTGCSMMTMSSRDSRTLYAGMWDFRRKGWTFRSGGESPTAPSASALYKTVDGGATWTELNQVSAKGLPAKPWGRIAVAAAPSNPDVVYALIESTRSALFRSADGGKTWQERDRSQMMVWRPFYFANLIADPKDENKLYKAGGGLIVSSDGGSSFSGAGGAHGDFHDVWIDPGNTNEVISTDDGGVWYSHDSGNSWLKANNLPISQFYHVSVDNENPYHVYGGLQDNSVWIGDSAYPGGITNSRWENLGGGDGFFAFADPADKDYAYIESQGGYIARVNRRTLESRSIQPQPNYGEGKLRFNWNTPMHLSPNEKGVLYIGAQFLFRSRDHGQTWDRISPDLTTNDPSKQKQEESGGVTVDNSSAETHTTIYSIAESPRNGQVIWAGTDDGNLQVTRDGGKTWTNVVGNVPDLPKASWVAWVEASRFDEATAYAVFDRHTFGDMDPHVFRTTNFGATWSRIPARENGVRGYAHVIKEDVVSPRLLFLGTEFGLWVSIDGGQQWAQYKGSNFPAVAVRDIVVQPRESDLVLATHGRGIWIIDDITPLRQLTPEVLAKDATFLESKPAQPQLLPAGGGWAEGDGTFVGPNPPDAAVITYYQKKRHIFGRMKIEVFDAQGKLVDTLPANSRRGVSRIEWSMRLKAPRVPPAAIAAGEATVGPRVLPGDYTVKMTRGQETYSTTIRVSIDPRAAYTLEDRKLQFDASMRVYALLADLTFDVDRINGVRDALTERVGRLGASDPLRVQLNDLATKADEIRKKIVATKEGGAITGEERIREKTSQLYGALVFYEGRPADYYVARIDSLAHERKDVADEFESFVAKDLEAANASLAAKKLDAIRPPTREAWEKAKVDEESGGSSALKERRLSEMKQSR
jgi:photosystem II stability/assembly factor-like uncharacterized protein